jgi:hypothetical protein
VNLNCSVGRAIIVSLSDEPSTFAHHAWLADLLSTRPPEIRFWNKPPAIDKWLTEINERDFLDEISSGDTGEDIIIFGGADVQSSEFSWDADIESALVEPANALALVRALQTAEEPLDFKLPEAGPDRYGDSFSFSETAFGLEGWIRLNDSDGRFDEGDRFASASQGLDLCPSNIAKNRLWPEMKFSYGLRFKESRFRTSVGRIEGI